MKIWLLVFGNGTIMIWNAMQVPRGSNFESDTRLFETLATTSLAEIADWLAYGMPDISWLKEIKNW